MRTWRVPCRRGRAQYLPRAKTVSGGRFFFGAHFSLGGKKAVSIKFSLFRRGGFHIRPSSNFDLSVRLGKGAEQKITTKPVGVDALGDPKTMEFDLFYGYMQTNSLKKFINFKIIKSFVSGRRGRRPLPVTENSILHGQT